MDDRIYKTLSQASSDVMKDKVNSLCIFYITKDGDICSAYDKEDDASVLDMIGALEVLKQRLMHGYDIVPEISDSNDSE